MGNEKWMAAHTVLLTGVLGSYIWAHYFALNYTAYKIYGVVNTLCYILMAFIMDQVNGPQYIVWANKKFVGRDTREVSVYILHDKGSTINEDPELSNDLVDSEKEIRVIDVSNDSLFEYQTEQSSCSSSIAGIA
jgi:hypothetical protein